MDSITAAERRVVLAAQQWPVLVHCAISKSTLFQLVHAMKKPMKCD